MDPDEDGCGNICDGDFDQDGAVAGTDFFILEDLAQGRGSFGV